MENVYVADTNRVTISCPKCGSEKKINVTNSKDTTSHLKIILVEPISK